MKSTNLSAKRTFRDTLPHSETAEKATLGGIFFDIEAILTVKPILSPDDFYFAAHQRIYTAILDVQEDGLAVDIVSVVGRLQDKGELDKIGGPAYLSELADSTPTAANVESHARIVQEKSTARRIIEEAQKVITSALDPLTKPEEIPTKLSIETSQKIEINHVFAVIKRLQQNIKNGYPGLYPGYDLLSRTIRKVSPGHLWVVGGYTSVGKSAWLVDFICRMYRGTTENPGIAVFSTEMACEQYLLRCISNETGVPSWCITENELKPDQAAAVIKAQSRISSRNLYIYDNLYKIQDIERTSRLIKDQRGLDIIAIDYLQNLWGEGTIYERMSKVAPVLQYLAKDLHVTIIALSQVSNQHVREKQIELHGYKGAGEIAASADLGIEIQRDQAYKDRMKFMVKKNRHGRTAEGMLEYTNDYTRLKEITGEADNE